MTPWIDKLTTYLSDPLNSKDPEPYNKRYSAGRAELEYRNLEQNHTTIIKPNQINLNKDSKQNQNNDEEIDNTNHEISIIC